jgi:uncharacterized protein (TIGR03435 family)
MPRAWILLVLAAGGVLGQTRPTYEAASVKLNTSGIGGSSSNGDQGQVLMKNQTLKRLVERAYDVKPFQVVGPSWLENVRFDIAAKYPAGTKNPERPLMLRTLLEDRLKLAVHRESKEMPGYALVAAKGGFRLKPVEPGADGIDHIGGKDQRLTATKVSMGTLAEHVARMLGETVVNQSGIGGVYNFELHWTTPEQGPNDDAVDVAAARVAALQEALDAIGLRLRPQKVPVEVVVVDHAERVPSEN